MMICSQTKLAPFAEHQVAPPANHVPWNPPVDQTLPGLTNALPTLHRKRTECPQGSGAAHSHALGSAPWPHTPRRQPPIPN